MSNNIEQSNVLVNYMQKYVQNISCNSSTTSNCLFSSTPRFEQQICITPTNTQTLFSNSYCNVSQNLSLVSNYNFDPYNQPQQQHQQQQPQFRPITKKINLSCEDASTSSEYSSFSPSSFESPQSFRKFYNKQKKQTPKKALPIRSEAVDLSEHIENAKRLKQVTNKTLFCTFCKNNGEKEEVFCSHLLKDSTGKITCPVLKKHVCPICQETGEKAHTITYCKNFQKSKRDQFIQNALDRIINE